MRIIYKELKNNSIIAKASIAIAIVSILASMGFAYMVTKDSDKILYAVNDKGTIVPLNRLDEKKDRIIMVKSAIAYFVDSYYSIDQFNMEKQIERVLWLADDRFKSENVDDKKRKGYYNRFMQTGIIQKASVDEKSIKISSYDPPYQVHYDVIINSINGAVTETYKVTNTATLVDVNLNYPYNPFGILYTNFSESNLQRVER